MVRLPRFGGAFSCRHVEGLLWSRQLPEASPEGSEAQGSQRDQRLEDAIVIAIPIIQKKTNSSRLGGDILRLSSGIALQ
jgi:hypothetical protein